MSTLTPTWVPVPSLYLGAQIRYLRREWIVLEVLEWPPELGGWTVIAHAVDDPSDHPRRWPLPYAQRDAKAELENRILGAAR